MGLLIVSPHDRFPSLSGARASWYANIYKWGEWTFAGHGVRRIPSLEGARGLAMIFVFLIHLHELLLSFGQPGRMTVQMTGFLYTVGNLAGDFFLMITGCVIYKSLLERPVAYGLFLRQRLLRIYPVFLTVLAVYVLLCALFPGSSKLPEGWGASVVYVLENAALLPGLFPAHPLITVSWTLSYVVLFYLTIPLVIDGGRLRSRSAADRVGFFALALVVLAMLCQFSGVLPLRFNMLLVGVLLAELVIWRKRRPLPGWALTLMTAAIPAGIGFRYLIVQWEHLSIFECCRTPLQTAITALCLFSFCYFALAPDAGWTRFLRWTPLRWFGNMSFSYYLGHSLAIKCFALLAAPLLATFPLTTFGFWAVQPALFLISLAPCIVLFVFVERPFRASL